MNDKPEPADRTRFHRSITHAFGNLRAEQMNHLVFELYTQPNYFDSLKGAKPVVLVGGRGTGKTTTLRALSWQGQQSLTGADTDSWEHFGLYFRFDTREVAMMDGAGLDEATWSRLFAHYLNLALFESLVEMGESLFGDTPGWHSVLNAILKTLDPKGEAVGSVSDPSKPSGTSDASTPSAILALLRSARWKLQDYVNNLSLDPPHLIPSLRFADIVAREFGPAVLSGRPVLVLLDEYENLWPYQQRVVNTLVKHADSGLAYKIGMRREGLRDARTLNPNEYLQTPADYDELDIERELEINKSFLPLVRKVIDARLGYLIQELDLGISASADDLLPGLSLEDEADSLGLARLDKSDLIDEVAELAGDPSAELRSSLAALSKLDLHLIRFRFNEEKSEAVAALIGTALVDDQRWLNTKNNYAYASLFELERRSQRPRKYYAGLDQICALSHYNLRYALQLVERCIRTSWTPDSSGPVSPADQTRMAREVARGSLLALAGVSQHGSQLGRLVVGLGTLFGALARTSRGRTPEVNQFYLRPANADVDEKELAAIDEILRAGVMNLAIVRLDVTKKVRVTMATDADYMLHPLFSCLFYYSHRRKRKIDLTHEQLREIIDRPDEVLATTLELRPEIDQGDALFVARQLNLFTS